MGSPISTSPLTSPALSAGVTPPAAPAALALIDGPTPPPPAGPERRGLLSAAPASVRRHAQGQRRASPPVSGPNTPRPDHYGTTGFTERRSHLRAPPCPRSGPGLAKPQIRPGRARPKPPRGAWSPARGHNGRRCLAEGTAARGWVAALDRPGDHHRRHALYDASAGSRPKLRRQVTPKRFSSTRPPTCTAATWVPSGANCLLPCVVGGDPQQLPPAVMTGKEIDEDGNFYNRLANEGRISVLTALCSPASPSSLSLRHPSPCLLAARGTLPRGGERMFAESLLSGAGMGLGNPLYHSGRRGVEIREEGP